MPRFDGKGPEGNGELTGRGIGAINGKCTNGANEEFQQNFVMENDSLDTNTGRGFGPCGKNLRTGLNAGGKGGAGYGARAYQNGDVDGSVANGRGFGPKGSGRGQGRGMGQGRGYNSNY